MNHLTETELIAFHHDELTSADLSAAAIRSHLDSCAACAATSDSIAQTLRTFSAEPVPTPNLEHQWQHLSLNLHTLTKPASRRRFAFFFLPATSLAFASLLVLAAAGLHFSKIHIIRGHHVPVTTAVNGHLPFTAQPTDPAIANHLDAAERLLTEVDHSSGPLDAETRSQAHTLLLQNAVYTRTARDQGNVAQAAVLDNLSRVLITLDNAPDNPGSTLDLRVEMNTSGLLFEIRILRQNNIAQ